MMPWLRPPNFAGMPHLPPPPTSQNEDMAKILSIADQHNLTKSDNVWIISQDILKSRELALKRNGFLIVQYTEEIDLLHSALKIIKNTFESYSSSVIRNKPAKSCKETGLNWKTGKLFLKLANFFFLCDYLIELYFN